MTKKVRSKSISFFCIFSLILEMAMKQRMHPTQENTVDQSTASRQDPQERSNSERKEKLHDARLQNAKKMAITSRGGFTARMLDQTGSHQTISNILALGEKHDERALTRAEAAGIVCRILGWNTNVSITSSKFEDVSKNHWYFGASHLVAQSGLMNAQTSFRPDATISPKKASFLLSTASGTAEPKLNGENTNFTAQDAFQSLLGGKGEDESTQKPASSEKMETNTAQALEQAVQKAASGTDSTAPLSQADPDSALNTLQPGKTNYKKIAKGRQEVKAVPKAERAAHYRELAKAVVYRNQRDNKGNSDVIPDHMCTVTSIAMALNQLGIGKPETKNNQFEDQLDLQLIKAKGRGSRGNPAARKSFLEEEYNLNVTHRGLAGALSTESKAKEFFTEVLLPQMEKGASAVMGMQDAQAYSLRHVVRIQWVTEKGLIIDDPFGKAIRNQGDSKYNYNGGTSYNTRDHKGSGARGEDNLWSWKMLARSNPSYIQIMNTKKPKKKS